MFNLSKVIGLVEKATIGLLILDVLIVVLLYKSGKNKY